MLVICGMILVFLAVAQAKSLVSATNNVGLQLVSSLHPSLNEKEINKFVQNVSNRFQNLKRSRGVGALLPHIKETVIVVVGITITQQLVITILNSYLVPKIESKFIEIELENILKKSGVIGKFRVIILDCKQIVARTTTSPLGHHLLVLSKGLLSALQKDEIRAVIAHEVGHMKNQDVFKNMGWIVGSSVLNSLFKNLYIDYLVIRMFGKQSRKNEFLADIHSARILQSPYPMISALKKIAKLNGPNKAHVSVDVLRRRHEIADVYVKRPFFHNIVNSVNELFKILIIPETHPSTEDRIVNLHVYAHMSNKNSASITTRVVNFFRLS